MTITANPQGASITVDGVAYASPKSFTWVEGSTHTISAPVVVTNGARLSFVKWSDGGAQSHTITTSSSVTTFKVDYAVEYLVQATPSGPGGTVTVAPASEDGFYANGTTVGLSAASSAGYCFAGWTGLVGGTPSTTSVTANKAYSLVAKFQTGSVTLPFRSFALPRKGGNLSLSMSATSGCMWQATASHAWITIKSATSGTGSASLSFSVQPNNTGVARTGSVKVGDYVMTIKQGAS
jgi:uncharacterized repeat protein (TIGR02543 family)